MKKSKEGRLEPFDKEITIQINEEWFMFHFEKICKRYVKNPEKLHFILHDLRSLLKEANEI